MSLKKKNKEKTTKANLNFVNSDSTVRLLHTAPLNVVAMKLFVLSGATVGVNTYPNQSTPAGFTVAQTRNRVQRGDM